MKGNEDIAFYDGLSIKVGNATFYELTKGRFRKKVAEAIEKISGHLIGATRAADFGCGPGLEAVFLAARHPSVHVHAVDNSVHMIAHARARQARYGAQNAEFQTGIMTDTGWQAETFDIVYALGSMRKATRGAAINEAYRLLKPRGKLYIEYVGDGMLFPSLCIERGMTAEFEEEFVLLEDGKGINYVTACATKP
jgi:ubiquinone/menaquinone biosynthesis C-methylase UbiE